MFLRLYIYLGLLMVSVASSAQAGLLNRWSFNNAAGAVTTGTTGYAMVDSVSGSTALIRGAGATFTGTALTLPGTTNGRQTETAIAAFVDLPNGLVSPRTDLTMEVWATAQSLKSNQRVLDFGRLNTGTGEIALNNPAPGVTSATDDICLTYNRSTNANTQRFEGKANGGTTLQADTSLTQTVGTQYHFVVTFQDGVGNFGSNGGRLSWYQNGTLAATLDTPFHLDSIRDVNNWLGRSQFSGDSNSNISYNEFRLHDYAFTAAQVSASFTAGPDATFAAPVAQPDSITMHRGQKVLLPVLANDTGDIITGSIVIVQAPQSGTAVPNAAGQILYTQTTGSPSSDSFSYRVRGGGGQSNIATVSILFSNSLRVPSPTLNIPSTPPATAIQLVDAFPGVTFNQPVCLASPPADARRLYICEKGGLVKVIPDVTAASPVSSTFLDLPTLLGGRGETLSTTSEQGLLGLAFHPSHAVNRFFYVFYSAKKADNLVYERVARFTAQAGNPNVADPASELILLEQVDRAGNHNGGGLGFGPDGYLYISFGDEGGQNDQYNNAQHIDLNFFSAIARIDVDKKAGSIAPNSHPAVLTTGGVARYAIPSDNPFVGATSFNGIAVNSSSVRTEFFAVGMRNPWRFSFDSSTGELWLADVGQNTYEEIDLVTKGGNYGWDYREGLHPGPKTAPSGFTSINPIYEYTHGTGNFQGNSVTGGLVYRGSRFGSFIGAYIFADYVSGNVWSLVRNGAAAPTVTRLTTQAGLVAFGSDPSNQDVLAANINNGTIQRLITGTVSGTFPDTLSATGLFADLTDLSPNPGILPYQPNLTFWSDFAVKRRWFAIPNASSKMTWSRDGKWTFPDGEIWVKHFDMELTRTNPPISGGTGPRKRIETRLIVKNATGSYGVSYRWNDAGTEATLVPDEGVSFPITVSENGVSRTQTWQIPSRGSCLTCHTPQAGHALSFNTRQLNLTNTLNGFAGNQLDLLRNAGYFSNTPDSPNLLPRHLRPDETNYPVEARVRSYLAVNCAYCHQAGGTGPSWDGLPELSLAETGLVNGVATNALQSGDKLVVPNDLNHSVVRNRIALTNGYTRMPPIASSELDLTNIALVENWISNFNATHQTYDQWHVTEFGTPTPNGGDGNSDPDFDGQVNYNEFLAGTDPQNGSSSLKPVTTLTNNMVNLSFSVPQNRSVFVETSTDLNSWHLWDVPGNNSVAQPGGPILMSGVPEGSSQFFRVRLEEN